MLSDKEIEQLMNKKPNLSKQTYTDIDSLDISASNVISRQATLNIGTIGHVAHGKSTLVKAITNVNTVKHKKEKIRNITIKLGYANAKLYKCTKCPSPKAFKSFSSNMPDNIKCENLVEGKQCGAKMTLLKHVSFVDCPGHDILMATMLTGAAIMDYAFLLVAGNMYCPQNQTSEHLAAVEIMKLDKIIILQNKIDLIFHKEGAALENYNQIKTFVKGTAAEKSPIIPISAQFNMNIDYLIQYMCEYFPMPIRELKCAPLMIVIRSFDVNKPGADHKDIKGGIAGGSILKGVLKVGDEIEIRPGLCFRDSKTGILQCQSLLTHVTSLFAESNELLYAVPGGLIGMGTNLDPYLTRMDRLVGNVIGYKNNLPDVYDEVDVDYYLLTRLLGVKSENNDGKDKISKIKNGEILKLNVGSVSCGVKVIFIKPNTGTIKLSLVKPICVNLNEKVAISRKILNNWRLIGWGIIKSGRIINSNE